MAQRRALFPPQGPTLTLAASREPNKIMTTQMICLEALFHMSTKRFCTAIFSAFSAI
jgi:hypothetical protein